MASMALFLKMKLDLSRVEHVRCRGRKTIARCPACAQTGQDRKGEHLLINETGRFGCVVYPGDSPEAKAHRKQIFALCGIREIQPLIVKPDAAISLSIGVKASQASRVGTLGRQGRHFPYTHLYSEAASTDTESEDRNTHKLKDCETCVPSVRSTQVIKLHRPLTKRERELLAQAGSERDPIIFEALRLFNATVAEVIPPEHP